MYADLNTFNLAPHLFDGSLESFNLLSSVSPEFLTHLETSFRTFFYIFSDFVVLSVAVLKFLCELTSRTYIFDPICQIQYILCKFAMQADVVKLGIRFQFKKIIIAILLEVLEVHVNKSEDEVFAVFMLQGQISEFFPFKFIVLALVENLINSSKKFA